MLIRHKHDGNPHLIHLVSDTWCEANFFSLHTEKKSTKIANLSWTRQLWILTSNWFSICSSLFICFTLSAFLRTLWGIAWIYCCGEFSEIQKRLFYKNEAWQPYMSHAKYLCFLWQHTNHMCTSNITIHLHIYFMFYIVCFIFESKVNLHIKYFIILKREKKRLNKNQNAYIHFSIN